MLLEALREEEGALPRLSQFSFAVKMRVKSGSKKSAAESRAKAESFTLGKKTRAVARTLIIVIVFIILFCSSAETNFTLSSRS